MRSIPNEAVRRVALAVVLTVAVWAVYALPVPSAVAHAAPAKGKGNVDIVQLKTLRFENGRQDDDGNVFLKGLIEIKYKSTRILAETVEYNRDTGRGTLSGNVQITQSDTDLRAAKVSIDIQAEKLVVDGGARVVQYEAAALAPASAASGSKGSQGASAQAGKTDSRRERFNLTADKLEYSMSTEDMTAAGNVTIKRKQQVITAQKLAYDKKKDEVTISGGVRALEENKFDVTTDALRIAVDSGAITFLGPISGDLFFERQEDQAASK